MTLKEKQMAMNDTFTVPRDEFTQGDLPGFDPRRARPVDRAPFRAGREFPEPLDHDDDFTGGFDTGGRS
jgi:hypothetical protein